MANYGFGDIIKFTYNPPKGKKIQGIKSFHDKWVNDKFKEVLVLHPMWKGEVHALDLKRMNQAERQVLYDILNPDTEKPHRLPLVNDILNRMDPRKEIKSPITFYAKFVKPFLRTTGDVYRKYNRNHMLSVKVVKDRDLKGEMINTNPVFKKK